MIKKFRQYILEAEKSEFTEKHIEVSGAKYHEVKHDKKLDDHNVNTTFVGIDGHYNHSFDVNGSMKKNDKIGTEKGMHVFSHVRDVSSSFIKHYSPKTLSYSAYDSHFNHMYHKLGQYLAKKHSGTHEYDKSVDCHTVIFK